MKKVTVKVGTHGNDGFFYVYENGAQIATYANSARGLQLRATYANGRRYECSKEYPSFDALAKAKGWEAQD